MSVLDVTGPDFGNHTDPAGFVLLSERSER
jgi:hypothetical protein